MFDDLRNSADGQPDFLDDSELELDPLMKKKTRSGGAGFSLNSSNFLGMNARQRFMISVLMFFLVIILGTMMLMITSSSLMF